ncbi:UAA transporter family protein [Nitzschia inconspicua]|uniref:UAA transporter family protein n=1 Tax=Nitzschia inconspicua TaxID=303405 RepID=A0A9K3PZM2_9STRA|nr:UAA transporter family protein [Nitzschia inconspicua]
MGKNKKKPTTNVKVLTVGGVASPGRKNGRNSDDPRRNKPKEVDPAEAGDVLFSNTSSGGTAPTEYQSESSPPNNTDTYSLEYEASERAQEDALAGGGYVPNNDAIGSVPNDKTSSSRFVPENEPVTPIKVEDLYQEPPQSSKAQDLLWLFLCFIGIMTSFVCHGLMMEYATSGGRKLHELSFLFVTSGLYTLTAAAGRYVRGETPTTIPPPRFAILGLTSMGSTFTSVRSLRYVIYPIQVLAKSCKPVPVMLMGTLMGKRYDMRKYINVVMIVSGVALFMGGGENSKNGKDDGEKSTSSQMFGILLLFISLCFDGGTGAYEDKLMSVHSVQPFDLMFNIQLGKTILAGVCLLVLNQLHIFISMVQEMGWLLLALGLSGAAGQVFIFVTIAKFGALTCSIIGLARKITTLLASIYFYGHHLNGIQVSGLVISVTAMVMNFMGKSKKGVGHAHGSHEQRNTEAESNEEMQKILAEYHDEEEEEGDVELAPKK